MGVTLLQGDCLDLLPTLDAHSVDSIVTDPPWMDYATGRYDASEWHRPVTRLTPETYMPELYRVLRADRAMVLWCRWDCFDMHAQAAQAAGFVVKNCIVWAKSNHTAGDLEGNLGNMHEVALFAVKGRWQRHDKREVNLWQVPHLFSRAKRHHPTEKPVALMARAIRLTTRPGDYVLDPFMGSGTTGVACIETGRAFIGMEKDPAYYAIAAARLAHAQPALIEGVA